MSQPKKSQRIYGLEQIRRRLRILEGERTRWPRATPPSVPIEELDDDPTEVIIHTVFIGSFGPG